MGSTILALRAIRRQDLRASDRLTQSVPDKVESHDATPLSLEVFPNPDDIRQFLDDAAAKKSLRPNGHFRRFYSEKPPAAAYVTVKGQMEICLVVREVTNDQADVIEAAVREDPSGTTLVGFQTAVENVLGKSVNPDQPIGAFIANWHWMHYW